MTSRFNLDSNSSSTLRRYELDDASVKENIFSLRHHSVTGQEMRLETHLRRPGKHSKLYSDEL